MLSQKIVFTDEFSNVDDLRAVFSPEGNFMLVWTDQIGKNRQVKTMLVSSSGEEVTKPVQLTQSESNNYNPNLAIDQKQRWHLVWREEDRKDFKLYYQQFNHLGEIDSSPIFIDAVNTGSASLLIREDNLYMVWNKGKMSLRDKSNNLFGTVINLQETLDDIEILQLTNEHGHYYYHPSIAMDSLGEIHLIYQYNLKSYGSLVDRTYLGDFSNQKKKADWIYPEPISSF
ncbi:MAG: hypothetical protein KAX49_05710 [Halanaerobiales bacterium]|nr:hypothetical protein [Halanaerobiales bacterium]